ncbi:hypothetical protein [Neolewinella xylanilytica]|uniref:hypothetical protein n=1 Tax=Neolewinella xylanilytica TaxID=1514080 RepID=UPI000CEAE25B|nr:hypothetical protein [Neolewinella xylanilytica]
MISIWGAARFQAVARGGAVGLVGCGFLVHGALVIGRPVVLGQLLLVVVPHPVIATCRSLRLGPLDGVVSAPGADELFPGLVTLVGSDVFRLGEISFAARIPVVYVGEALKAQGNGVV